MAQYNSKYAELAFYVNGSVRKFSNGVYKTEDKTEIAVLDGLTDATRVDEPKESVSKTDSKPEKTEPKTEEASNKSKPQRKSSAK